jgi:hypothetical protein
VVAANSPGGDLKLGYEDDHYSDNGYWSHDDGTGDQCKGQPNAWVVIAIHHNATAPPETAAAPRKFDLVWTANDDSGFPLNPIWGTQLHDDTVLPDPASCESLPQNFSDPSCSSQSPSIDIPTGWNATWCATTGTPINGHVNWFPVTYVGEIAWSDHSGNDDDYNFEFSSPFGEADVPSNVGKNKLSLGPSGALGLEFDSDETIDHFHTNWWGEFHSAVDTSDTLASALVIPSNAVVTGLLGLDCEHTCRTEIHPVYDLAMQVFDPSDKTGLGGEVWGVFLRNFGDEGYCSSEDHRLYLPTLSIRIPWKQGATGVTILNKPDNSDNYFRTNNQGVSGPNITWAVGEGILIQFDVPTGLAHAMANGELHLNWVYGPGAGPHAPLLAKLPPKAEAVGTEEISEDEGEANVAKLYNALNPTQQQAARSWQKVLVTDPDVRAAPRRTPIRVDHLPVLRTEKVIRDIPVTDETKATNDMARAQALCAEYKKDGKPVPAACR